MERVLKPREQESDFAPASERRGLSLMAVSPSPAARPPVWLLLLPSIAVDKVQGIEVEIFGHWFHGVGSRIKDILLDEVRTHIQTDRQKERQTRQNTLALAKSLPHFPVGL